MITVDNIVSRMGEWKDKKVNVSELSGGLTNHNYRVDVDDAAYVIRISGENTEMLRVNRDHEYACTLSASRSGVGAKIHSYFSDLHIMVLEFIPGQTMSIPTLQTDRNIKRIAQALKRLHGSEPVGHHFNMFRWFDFYLGIVKEHEVAIPKDYYDHVKVVPEIEKAINRQTFTPVLCHNDLLAENFIDDGSCLRIIDYEYAGNNDPCFELGNIGNENEFNDEQMALLCESYFGQLYKDKLARMYLYHMMSKIGWTLWGCIQNKFSTIDFDFWAWSMHKWNKARIATQSESFGRWLTQAAQPS